MRNEREVRLREALRGLAVLVIGGDPRAHHTTRLRIQLGLGEVIHCATRKSDPTADCFRAALRNSHLVLVICARGLCRTHHAKALHGFCRRFGWPLLDCNHIPHPNAVIGALLEKELDKSVLCRSVEVRSLGGAA